MRRYQVVSLTVILILTGLIGGWADYAYALTRTVSVVSSINGFAGTAASIFGALLAFVSATPVTGIPQRRMSRLRTALLALIALALLTFGVSTIAFARPHLGIVAFGCAAALLTSTLALLATLAWHRD